MSDSIFWSTTGLARDYMLRISTACARGDCGPHVSASGDSAGVTSLRRLIEGLGVGAERFARLRVGIEHMPAAIEQELRARRVADRRQMVEHVAARGIG